MTHGRLKMPGVLTCGSRPLDDVAVLVQVPEACKRFSEVNAAVLTNNPELRKCFVAHMLTLWDYGLVDP